MNNKVTNFKIHEQDSPQNPKYEINFSFKIDDNDKHYIVKPRNIANSQHKKAYLKLLDVINESDSLSKTGKSFNPFIEMADREKNNFWRYLLSVSFA